MSGLPLAWYGFHQPLGSQWLLIALSYLLGAVPFSFLMVRLFKGLDLRSVGSGNIGATNAMRVLGRPLGLVAFFLDCLKGYLPAALAPGFAGPGQQSSLAVLCGAAAVLGHVFPIYLGFKGGKAVATGCGAILGIDPWIFLYGGLVWLAAVLTTRLVSLASLSMCLAFVVVAQVRSGSGRYGSEVAIGCLGLFVLVLIRHRANIGRILRGEEPRIGARRAAASTEHEPRHG